MILGQEQLDDIFIAFVMYIIYIYVDIYIYIGIMNNMCIIVYTLYMYMRETLCPSQYSLRTHLILSANQMQSNWAMEENTMFIGKSSA